MTLPEARWPDGAATLLLASGVSTIARSPTAPGETLLDLLEDHCMTQADLARRIKRPIMIFHLAIPSRDLKESAEFYKILGCGIGRCYETHFIVNFFGSQLVCHLSGKWDREVEMYPRHLGVIFSSERELIEIIKRVSKDGLLKTFIWEKKFVRKKGKPEKHTTFFLKDPSNNLIEFKWYKNQGSIF